MAESLDKPTPAQPTTGDCCSPTEQETCCDPAEKDECCSPDHEPGTCGCVW